MATLLNAVNETLKKSSLIQGDSGELSTLTDSARQVYIDLIVQLWNEVLDELYHTARSPRPNVMSSNTITLATGDRDYALQSDLITLLWPLLDQTNGRYIQEYDGDYQDMFESQPIASNFTGLPIFGVIRPSDGQLYLDRVPTATENGLVYTYNYKKDTELSAAADVIPVNNVAYRALIGAVSELWKRERRNQFDEFYYTASIGRAARAMRGEDDVQSYIPRRISQRNTGIAFPFDE